ncbi:unnamed protein product [Sphenostylis stenocarpa]|uniref:Uncharacterized protein n=1 Tax=Sphenostylis stenocarpa TaxID=92480 RepID=A0AA86VQQ7_9FABA|nr:unnamed protein product [Sphenostylis stenocarpa]
MATTFKYLVSIIFLTLVIKGSGYCNLNNINIGTTKSGRDLKGITEWNVVVTNNCSCAQSQIRLKCQGFQTVESVDPSILKIESGGICLLINGNPLKGFASQPLKQHARLSHR